MVQTHLTLGRPEFIQCARWPNFSDNPVTGIFCEASWDWRHLAWNFCIFRHVCFLRKSFSLHQIRAQAGCTWYIIKRLGLISRWFGSGMAQLSCTQLKCLKSVSWGANWRCPLMVASRWRPSHGRCRCCAMMECQLEGFLLLVEWFVYSLLTWKESFQ